MEEDGRRGLIVVSRERVPADRPRSAGVREPGKLIRIAAMLRELLTDLGDAPLDEAGRARIRQILDHTLVELSDVLSEDLRRELAALAPQLDRVPSDSEVRVAQAQLMGWLTGLLHGLEAAVLTRFVESQADLQERTQEAAKEEEAPGRYL